jgi:hypothetical protein
MPTPTRRKKKSKERKAEAKQDVEGPEDAIDEFFSQYSGFLYHRDAPIRYEFQRLCRFCGWDYDNPERERAWSNLRIATVMTFNSTIGDDINDHHAWGNLCRLVGIADIPNDIDGRRQVCESFFKTLR